MDIRRRDIKWTFYDRMGNRYPGDGITPDAAWECTLSVDADELEFMMIRRGETPDESKGAVLAALVTANVMIVS